MAAGPWKTRFFDLAEQWGVLRALQNAGEGAGQSLYVLAYHRVDTPEHRPWLNPGLINATPAQFQEQMSLVAACYHPVDLETVLVALDGQIHLPRAAVLVTVDDGYRDFQEVIFPVCRSLGICPVLFVPTSFVEIGDFWWDRIYRAIFQSALDEIVTPKGLRLSLSSGEQRAAALCQASGYIKEAGDGSALEWVDEVYRMAFGDNAAPDRSTLDWSELRSLAKQGVTLAAHTQTHPILGRIPLEQARLELRRSRQILMAETGESLPCTAYPDGLSGTFNAEILNVTREEGYRLAFTMLGGRANLDRDDSLRLPRLGTWSQLTTAHFHTRMTPAFGAFRRWFPEDR